MAACPFDQRLATKLAQAEANVAAGLADEEDMDDERLGRTAVSVLEEALASRPSTEDLVVTHGDA
ncbi:APH(3') family aminoglycoside O-phosphotransferase, partial [Acinetobacter baumannii]